MKSDPRDIIYSEYYEKWVDYSSATSSHWRKYGKFQDVKKVGGRFIVAGAGFGDFIGRNLVRTVMNIPSSIYVRNMLKSCDPNIVAMAQWVARKQSRLFSYDIARMALTLDFLTRQLGNLDSKTVCIIGDGYGSLGSLIKKIYPGARVIFVNLGRTLFFDAHYSINCFPDARHSLCRDSQFVPSADFTYVEAEKFREIDFSADIYVNIASMQEMDYSAIESYMNHIQSRPDGTYFYCCNRVAKTLPDGTVIEFANYGWSDRGRILVDELCPWYQRFPINRPPFYHSFDGPIAHRLMRVGQ